MPRLFVFFCFLQSCGGIAFHDQICKTIYFHRLATMRWRGVGLQGWGVHPWLHEVRIPPCLVCTCTVISTSVPHYGYKITSRTDQPHILCWSIHTDVTEASSAATSATRPIATDVRWQNFEERELLMSSLSFFSFSYLSDSTAKLCPIAG